MASSQRMCLATIGLAAALGLAAWPAKASDSAGTRAIERVLSQIAAGDEAVLREAVLGMRDAETAIRSGQGAAGGHRFAEWAEIFIARLAGLSVPEGTRAVLRAGLAEYSRDALRAIDTVEGTHRAESLATLTGH